MAKGQSRALIMASLGDYKPKSAREVVEASRLSEKVVYNALCRCWKEGSVLRTKKPFYEYERIFKGRAGVSQNTRPYHLYLLRPEGKDSMIIDGLEFVAYAEECLDVRGGGRRSKAQAIFDFIRKNKNRAFFLAKLRNN